MLFAPAKELLPASIESVKFNSTSIKSVLPKSTVLHDHGRVESRFPACGKLSALPSSAVKNQGEEYMLCVPNTHPSASHSEPLPKQDKGAYLYQAEHALHPPSSDPGSVDVLHDSQPATVLSFAALEKSLSTTFSSEHPLVAATCLNTVSSSNLSSVPISYYLPEN